MEVLPRMVSTVDRPTDSEFLIEVKLSSHFEAKTNRVDVCSKHLL